MTRLKGPVIVAAVTLAGAVATVHSHTAHAGMMPTAQPPGKPLAAATAEIKGDGITGTAELVEIKPDNSIVVELTIKVSGLKPGKHGVHLHAIGKCEPPGFTSAGGHYDPGPAGNTDPDANHPYHMGDLPNLEVGADGRGVLSAHTTRVTISDGPISLFDADGSAIIVHGNPDQGITGEAKSGVSGGPRVACGVIVKK
jgi:superoxide dismutase, Cu-Zn family